MSADNWDHCPACAVEHDEAIGESAKKVEEAYGKVPVETFDKMREDHRKFAERVMDNTLREDYEFYREGFVLHIDYRAACSNCGYKHVYRHEVDSRSAYDWAVLA